MSRMLTFAKYLVIFIAFYFFVDFICFVGTSTMYKNLDKYSIECTQPEVTIEEAKATSVNGYIKGKIKNNTNEIINKKYLKINLIADNGINLGEKFIEISQLKQNETVDFTSEFNMQYVKEFKISLVDFVEGAKDEALISDKHYGFFTLTSLLIMLYII